MLLPAIQTTVVIIHAGNKPAPFIAGTFLIQQRSWACFATPVVVRDNIAERNIVLGHQASRQFGSTVISLGLAVRTYLAHLNGDGIPVSRPALVRMVPPPVQWQMLDGMVLVHSKMPAKTARFPLIQIFGMTTGISRRIGRTVNRNKAGAQRTGIISASPRRSRHVVPVYPHFPVDLGDRTRNQRNILRSETDKRRTPRR